MAKETTLYNNYLDLVEMMAENPEFLPLLMDIGDLYLPRQRQSIHGLLEKIKDQSAIFIQCLNIKDVDSEQNNDIDNKSKNLAQRIINTALLVNQKVESLEKQRRHEKSLLYDQMPIEQAYKEALSSLRFDYMCMKDPITQTIFKHYFHSQATQVETQSQAKIIRLAQEIADLSSSLPCEHTNAMFCRVDKTRVDLMRVMTMGAAGTPYAHGAFVFDLFFPVDYPN